ncbi:MAG: hypothetical protein E5X41_30485 [Mesorhizobium sp.]|nr:MAG: hypothetical protein E5X41_30485 [Mesorhizobium sp.]
MWGKRKLAWLIRREGVAVSISTIGRILTSLVRRGLVMPVPTLRRKPVADASALSASATPDACPSRNGPARSSRSTPSSSISPLARPSSTSPPTIRSPNGPSPASPAGLKASLPASFAMLTDPGVRHAYNEAFVAAEVRKFQPFFDDLVRRSFFDQQREACIRLEDNNLLVASAGSGKSATRVCKVANVLERQLYRPDEILLLAFNKSAADELKTRIARQLHRGKRAGVPRHDVSPLGRGIIKEVEGRPPQLAEVPHI